MIEPHTQTFQAIVTEVKKNNPDADIDLLTLAYDVARTQHAGQKRVAGGDFIIHPLHVALYLAEHGLDIPTITAGLLHDIVEDTPYTIEELKKNFGDEIAELVAGVTVLGKLRYQGVERYVENLRKMFVAMTKDLRVILIKFADRIDNLKTLEIWSEDKRRRIAQETIEIYAPIANRLSLGQIKMELEDLAFQHLDPEAYRWTQNLLRQHSPKRLSEYLAHIKDLIAETLKKHGIKPVDIHGRNKGLYSLYQKLLKYNRDITRLHDLVTLRVIVRTEAECYAVLGIIHERWRPVKGRIKDYIATPKPNGYRSLHTTVFCEEEEIVEFQIRTRKMHEDAEFGVSSHWRYKERPDDKRKVRKTALNKIDLDWMRELARWHKRIRDNSEKIEHLKLEVFQNRIFVFTPKGEIIDLPEDATPVDFAYHIHTDLGDRCISAIVNDQITGLDTRLKSGDIVEIKIDKHRKGPSPEWLKFVKTTTARSKIKNKVKVNLVDWLKRITPAKK